MFSILLLVIGFIFASGTFGSGVIGAFSLVQYWLWVVCIALTILGVVIGLSAGNFLRKVPYSSGISVYARVARSGAVGGIIAAVLAAMSYVQLWLTYYIVDHVSPGATGFGDLSGSAMVGIAVFLVSLLVSIYNTKFKLRK